MRGAPDRVIVVLLCVLVLPVQAGTVIIKECSSGNVTLDESKTPAYLTCDGFTPNDNITWRVNTNPSPPTVITCPPQDTTCEFADTQLFVNRTGGESRLRIPGRYRLREGDNGIMCSAANQTAVCTVNVIAGATLSNCDVTLNDTDWTVTGRCPFKGAYSSKGVYSCTWHQRNHTQHETVIPGEVKKTERNTSTGVYYEGNCTFMTSLSPRQGEGRYSYSVSFSPGPEYKPTGESVTIQSPGDPVTNCPQYVYEGQSISCECLVNPSSQGFPPATAQWQWPSPDEQQEISDVTRNDSGSVFTCSLSWGPAGGAVQKHTEYTLNVADPPPFPPVISGYNDRSVVTAGNPFTLTCTVTGGRPLVTSVNVSCGLDVQGVVSMMNATNTSVSVTFTIDSIEARHDGTECVCTGDWEVHREAYNVSARIQLRVMDTFVFPLSVVAGVAGGSVVVTILVVVVVVVAVRKRRPVTKAKDSDEAGLEDDASTYDDDLERPGMPKDIEEDGCGYATVAEATSHRASSSVYGYAVPDMSVYTQPSGTSDRDRKTSTVTVEKGGNLYAEPDVPLCTHLTRASDRNRKASSVTVGKGGNLYAEPDVPLSTQPSGATVKESCVPTVTLREDGSLYAVMDIVSRVSVSIPSSALETPDDPATHTYAQVDKSTKRSKSTALVFNADPSASSADVYAQVNKASKKNTSAATEVDKGVGAHEPKPEVIVNPKPAFKPRISVKPKLNK